MRPVVLAGGGLANCLIAWRLRLLRPEVPVLLVEQGTALGGNHTWSLHAGDISDAQLRWLQPLVSYSWPGQILRFPAYTRRLSTAYHSITSGRLHQVLAASLGSRVRLGAEITDLHAEGLRLASGETIPASLVIDGRGAAPVTGLDLRWQKFLGQEVDLDAPHGLEEPVLMDATVEQLDGYRFVYVLPLAPQRLLIEDTYYSDGTDLQLAVLRQRVQAYAASRGWRITGVHREETGVLPIVLDGDPRQALAGGAQGVARSGMRAMLFHHTTGYSLPDAVRLADAIAGCKDFSAPAVTAMTGGLSLKRWQQQRFYRLLNRLMFDAAEPTLRYRTLEHFYRLPEPLIGRFYAGRTTLSDQLRVLSGKPPVPMGRALHCLLRSAWPRQRGPHLAAKGSA